MLSWGVVWEVLLGRIWSGERQIAPRDLLDTLSSERGSALGRGSPTGPLDPRRTVRPSVCPSVPPAPCRAPADRPGAHCLALHGPSEGSPRTGAARSRFSAQKTQISLIGEAEVPSWPRRPSLTGPPLTPPPTLLPSALLTSLCPWNKLAPRGSQSRDACGSCLGRLPRSPLGRLTLLCWNLLFRCRPACPSLGLWDPKPWLPCPRHCGWSLP